MKNYKPIVSPSCLICEWIDEEHRLVGKYNLIISMKTHVIQVDAFDDVHSIKDKMNWSNSARILLVIPDQAQTCKRKLDLVLLLRHAFKLGAQLGIVTDSVQIHHISNQLGIPVFSNSSIAQRRTWHLQQKPPSSILLNKKKPEFLIRKCQNNQRPQNPITQRSWFRIVLFCVALFACFLLIFIFLTSATVDVFLEEKIVSIDVLVVANPNIRTPSLTGEFPVKELSITLTKTATGASTGTAQVAEGYATGIVELTNLTDNALVIPAGALFASSLNPEKQFITEQDIVLPQGVGSTISIPVRAIAPGEYGNTPANELTNAIGPISGQISVTNTIPASGGTNVTMPAPTKQDIEKARANILAELSQAAIEDLSSSLNAYEHAIECSLMVKEISLESSFPEEGQPAGQFSLSMEVVYSVLVYDDTSIEKLGGMVLAANIPDGWTAKTDSFYFSLSSQPVKDVTGNITWVIRVAEIIQPEINVRQLANDLTSRIKGEAVQYIENHLDLREPVELNLWPSFWPWMPVLPARIDIQAK